MRYANFPIPSSDADATASDLRKAKARSSDLAFLSRSPHYFLLPPLRSETWTKLFVPLLFPLLRSSTLTSISLSLNIQVLSL
jgi:hypothetical protein